MLTRLTSGRPISAESSKPEAQAPSNPASSASVAESGLCAAMMRASPPSSAARSLSLRACRPAIPVLRPWLAPS